MTVRSTLARAGSLTGRAMCTASETIVDTGDLLVTGGMVLNDAGHRLYMAAIRWGIRP